MATLMELLERFVSAHEKQAEASMILAQGHKHECKCGSTLQVEHVGEATVVWTKEPEPTEAPTFNETPPADTTEAPTGWNPYTSPVQKVYRAPLAAVLDAELKRLGLEPGDKMTGAQKHQLILDTVKGTTAAQVEDPATAVPTAPAAPVEAVPAAPVAPVEATMPVSPTAPAAPVDYQQVKDAVYALYHKSPSAALGLMSEFTVDKSQRLTDPTNGAPTIPQDKWAEVMQKAIEMKG